MRIGLDARLFNETGVGRYVRNLILQLSKIDKENQYVVFLLQKDFNDVKIGKNFEKKIVGFRWHTIDEQLRFPSILNRENFDLVHFPYISVPIFYNKPFVLTIHDLIPFHFSTGKASTLPLPLYRLKLIGYKFVVSKAAKKAKKIIVPSNATKKEVADHLKISSDKIAVIYEGADEKLTKTSTNYKSPITNYFLYVGNAYPHKNLDRLIQAFNILISKYRNILLILVGPDDYFYKRLKEKVKKINLDDKVIFKNEVSDNELLTLYKNALALITPSSMEGFGLPGLEAMVNKCLVLASDIPVHREIYKDNAIYFDPNNTKDLENKMKEIYSNTLVYRSKIEDGFERAKEFSWEEMAKETLKVYESCAGL